jgi:hypothetical protein
MAQIPLSDKVICLSLNLLRYGLLVLASTGLHSYYLILFMSLSPAFAAHRPYLISKKRMSTMEMPSDPGYLSADRSGGLRSFCIVMAVMSVLSIVLRFLSRGMALPQTVHQGRFLLDDWLALAAVVSSFS